MSADSRLFNRLGMIMAGLFTLLSVSIHWEWNALMDEISFLRWMPTIQSIPSAFLSEVKDYSLSGRFYPVKYIFNLLRWRYTPLHPGLFHFINLLLFFAIAYLAAKTV